MSMKSRSGLWGSCRFILLALVVSLPAYVPFKYATQLHAIDGLYALLFPFSSVIALAGIALAVRPALGFQLPLWLRAGVSVLSVGWIATGNPVHPLPEGDDGGSTSARSFRDLSHVRPTLFPILSGHRSPAFPTIGVRCFQNHSSGP